MISIGILSTAEVNRQSLSIPVKKRSDCQVTAVASRSSQRAREYAKLHDIPTAYGTYQGLLDDPKIDVIYISTPNALHDFWTEKALQAGKHVLCEKPAFTVKGNAASLKKLALTRNLLLMEAMHYRYHPALKDFFGLLEKKFLGDIKFVKTSLKSYLPTRQNDIRLNAALKGGAFMHLGCYCLDAITSIVGEPLFFQDLNVVKKTNGVDLKSEGSLVTSDGKTRAEFLCDFDDNVFESEIEVKGEKGSMRLRSGLNPTNFAFENPSDTWILETDLQPQPCLSKGDGFSTYDFQLDYFIESLKKGNHTPKINAHASELLAEGSDLLALRI